MFIDENGKFTYVSATNNEWYAALLAGSDFWIKLMQCNYNINLPEVVTPVYFDDRIHICPVEYSAWYAGLARDFFPDWDKMYPLERRILSESLYLKDDNE